MKVLDGGVGSEAINAVIDKWTGLYWYCCGVALVWCCCVIVAESAESSCPGGGNLPDTRVQRFWVQSGSAVSEQLLTRSALSNIAEFDDAELLRE